MTSRDVNERGTITHQIFVQVQQHEININRVVVQDGARTTRLITVHIDPAKKDAMRVELSVSSMKDGKSLLSTSARAGSLSELRRKHGAVYRDHVAQFVEDLWRQGVLQVDEPLARQVCDDGAVTDELRTLIHRLVGQLDSDEYSEREAAQNQLMDLGPAAIAVLKDMKDLSLQQQPAVQVVIDAIPLRPQEQLQRLRGNADFLIDCLYSDHEPTRRRATARLAELTRAAIETDPGQDPRSQAKAIESLRDRFAVGGTTRPSR